MKSSFAKFFPTLLFILCLLGCTKEIETNPDPYPEFFQAYINGKKFEPKGHFWICQSFDGAYGEGLRLQLRNCDTDETLYLGKYESAKVGVYTLDNVPYEERPYCRFADTNYDFTNIEGESDVLSAHTLEEIRLEIIKVEQLEDDEYYVEARLDAVVSDPNIDTTIVISGVRFAYEL